MRPHITAPVARVVRPGPLTCDSGGMPIDMPLTPPTETNAMPPTDAQVVPTTKAKPKGKQVTVKPKTKSKAKGSAY